MGHETETFLVEKFLKEAESCTKIHPRKLKKLSQALVFLKSHDRLETTSGQLREDLYQVNNLLDECQILSQKYPFIGPKSLLDLGKNLNHVKDTLLAPKPRGDAHQDPDPDPTHVRVCDQVRDFLSRDPPRVWGFDEEMIEMERLVVTESKFGCVGVVGIAGIGKTTLCEEMLRRSEKVKKHFLVRVSVRISDKDGYEDVVRKTLDELGVEEETVEMIRKERGLPGLVCSLYVRLMGKRYLVVLDGVWSRDDWYSGLKTEIHSSNPDWGSSFAYGFPKGNGGVVIVTTRDEEVAENMVGADDLHRVFPLANEESTWKIFEDAMDMNREEFEPSEDVKKEILRKCGGVPMAARMMGKIMKLELTESQRLPPETFQALQFSDKSLLN